MSDTTSGAIPFASMFSDPNTMAILGAAGAASQMAMPTRVPVPFGAVLGATAGGFGQGARQAYENQLEQQKAGMGALQLQQMQAIQPYLLAQQKAINERILGGATGGAGGTQVAGPSAGAASDGSAPLIDPQVVAMLGIRAAMSDNPRGAAPMFDYLRSLTPSGGGYYIGQDSRAYATPGADPAAANRTLATSMAGVPAKIQEAWNMLGPDLQKKINDAGIDIFSAWHKPQQYTPGSTVGSPSQMQGAPGPDPFPGWAAAINRNENPTGNAGASNPNSTATGNGQFLNTTWPNVLRATRPDLAAGRSDAQLLPLRSNSDLALSATEMYARQNGAALANAGLPVNGSTVYMAHALGPQGAISVLQKPDNTPVASFLPAGVISANPYLQNGATAGSVRQHFAGLMPAQAPQQSTQPQGNGPATVPASPAVSEAEQEGKRLSGLNDEVLKQAKESSNAHLRIQQVQAAIADATKNGIPPGYFSPELAEAAAAAKSLGIDTKTLGVDPKAVTNVQAANEAMVQITGEILRRLFPQRITNMDIKLYGENLAHYGMDPGALQQVLTLADGAATWDTAKANNMLDYKANHNNSLLGWEPQFYKQNGYGPQFWDLMQASQKPGEGQALPNAPSTVSAGLPPAAVKALESGKITTFKNGQRWTLGQNGQPVQVQ